VHEANLLHLNCDQAGHQLDWHPQLSFEQTIDWTAKWYQKWSQNADMIDFTQQQIQSYQDMISRT
jgi:CDP-glucose 4,6-dehydratase